MNIKFEISKDDYNDLMAYCNLNNLDINQIVKKCFLEGYRIEKYGLLNSKSETIEKEVIKTIEVPVEVIKEITKIEYVEIEKPIEKIVEVIKEVPSPPKEVEVIKYVDREVIREVFIEKDVSNNDNFYDKNYVDELKQKIEELQNKPPQIKEVYIDKIIEVPKETIKEIIVERNDDTMKVKLDALQQTVMKLKEENINKTNTINELKKQIEENKTYGDDKPAVFLQGSNLNNKLLK